MKPHKTAQEYSDKQRPYFNVDRHDLFELVAAEPPGNVLEIGAGAGSTLIALKQMGRATRVVGVELMSLAEGGQCRQEIDQFIITDVEQHELDLPPESFDVIICGDVLEHLRDPWGTLEYLAGFLRNGGKFVISLPNIRHWRALLRIVLGDFRYAPSGVLDRTHLRFFARKNMVDLVESAKLKIQSIEPSFRRHRDLRRALIINSLTLGLLEPWLAQQYLIVAEKLAGSPDPSTP